VVATREKNLLKKAFFYMLWVRIGVTAFIRGEGVRGGFGVIELRPFFEV
jgi:hypothetical protein